MKRWHGWTLVLASGVAIPVGFPGLDQWYLTWFAFVPLLVALHGASRRLAVVQGLVCGFVANLVGYSWIAWTIHTFGGFPWVLAWPLTAALCAYQGILFALFSYLVVRFRDAGLPLVWVAPAAMVSLEAVYPLLFPIFMGVSLHPVPVLIQAADLLGPLLLTAVVLAFNGSVAVSVLHWLTGLRMRWWEVAAGPVAALLLVAYGLVRAPAVERSTEQGVPLTVGVVQANLGIFEKWHDVDETLARHERASYELEDRGAELVVWPEAAYVSDYIDPKKGSLRGRVCPDLSTPLLFGGLTRRVVDGQVRKYTSAILLDGDGVVLGTYDKTYLLAFGEYLPLGDRFPRLYDLSPNTSRFWPGTSLEPLRLEHEGRRWRIAPLICYEDILPAFSRRMVNHSRAHLLVNLTNDAWFGASREPRIHLALAKLRAVEHRRWMVRAANTGVSAIIDPTGRVVSHAGVAEETALLGTVRLLEGRTLYSRVGNTLGHLAILVVAVGLWRTRGRNAP